MFPDIEGVLVQLMYFGEYFIHELCVYGLCGSMNFVTEWKYFPVSKLIHPFDFCDIWQVFAASSVLH